MTQPENKPSPVVGQRSGVLTLYGYGIKVYVDKGHLLIEDGIGQDRRHFRLPRIGHGLRRLILIGEDGFVSLSALRWLADQEASFVLLERNGKVLTTTGPVRPSDARLRRAQALAHKSDLALRISRELISRKLAGQERVARLHLLDNQTADRIACHREELDKAESLKTVSVIEAHAAGHYWAAYQTLPVNFPKKDANRVPEHWKTFGNRASPLTRSPRRAVSPANAILNYTYSLAEAESRLAAAALGLDVGLAFLHHDAPNRDSLAHDLMEPIRPLVDAWLVDWITKETLRREWFLEMRDGGCRLMSELAERISETAPTWGRSVAPIAEWLAHALWSNQRRAPSERAPATRLTQRRRSEGRGNDYVATSTPVSYPAGVCSVCGAPTRGGKNCRKCGREVSREKLTELAKLGRIIAHSSQSRKKQSETMKRHEIAKRQWLSAPKASWPNEKTYLEDIQPRLPELKIVKIASTLGISEPYAAEIRAGRQRPHRRHWRALAMLVSLSSNAS
jgi:CRISPR-associated endonuclease Cas1